MKVTTRLFMMLVLLMMTTISAEAQKIEVVNAEGHAIPLVSVLTQDGILIGTTNMNGELTDVKGHTKVALTHVAYKPQLVTVDQTSCRFTMEDIDYGLAEVVVSPKPYLFKEYYYRAFRYIGDSLRVYSAGVIPVIYNIKNNYKGKTRTIWSYNTKANKAVTWQGVHMLNKVESWVKSTRGKMPEIMLMEPACRCTQTRCMARQRCLMNVRNATMPTSTPPASSFPMRPTATSLACFATQ